MTAPQLPPAYARRGVTDQRWEKIASSLGLRKLSSPPPAPDDDDGENAVPSTQGQAEDLVARVVGNASDPEHHPHHDRHRSISLSRSTELSTHETALVHTSLERTTTIERSTSISTIHTFSTSLSTSTELVATIISGSPTLVASTTVIAVPIPTDVLVSEVEKLTEVLTETHLLRTTEDVVEVVTVTETYDWDPQHHTCVEESSVSDPRTPPNPSGFNHPVPPLVIHSTHKHTSTNTTTHPHSSTSSRHSIWTSTNTTTSTSKSTRSTTRVKSEATPHRPHVGGATFESGLMPTGSTWGDDGEGSGDGEGGGSGESGGGGYPSNGNPYPSRTSTTSMASASLSTSLPPPGHSTTSSIVTKAVVPSVVLGVLALIVGFYLWRRHAAANWRSLLSSSGAGGSRAGRRTSSFLGLGGTRGSTGPIALHNDADAASISSAGSDDSWLMVQPHAAQAAAISNAVTAGAVAGAAAPLSHSPSNASTHSGFSLRSRGQSSSDDVHSPVPPASPGAQGRQRESFYRRMQAAIEGTAAAFTMRRFSGPQVPTRAMPGGPAMDISGLSPPTIGTAPRYSLAEEDGSEVRMSEVRSSTGVVVTPKGGRSPYASRPPLPTANSDPFTNESGSGSSGAQHSDRPQEIGYIPPRAESAGSVEPGQGNHVTTPSDHSHHSQRSGLTYPSGSGSSNEGAVVEPVDFGSGSSIAGSDAQERLAGDGSVQGRARQGTVGAEGGQGRWW